ncbi:hypothetical protein B0T21DRAFT_348975 [Apiosordaria backusii]|uniref:Uncharacterized protein n=1 Tax=Apiosordaria backusii TaxID=314023 RepID=A0AA40BJT6_9PEZI|nr:hypothetical protein B0T21DRAFT_348975 [Apiosordaria backusii]
MTAFETEPETRSKNLRTGNVRSSAIVLKKGNVMNPCGRVLQIHPCGCQSATVNSCMGGKSSNTSNGQTVSCLQNTVITGRDFVTLHCLNRWCYYVGRPFICSIPPNYYEKKTSVLGLRHKADTGAAKTVDRMMNFMSAMGDYYNVKFPEEEELPHTPPFYPNGLTDNIVDDHLPGSLFSPPSVLPPSRLPDPPPGRSLGRPSGSPSGPPPGSSFGRPIAPLPIRSRVPVRSSGPPPGLPPVSSNNSPIIDSFILGGGSNGHTNGHSNGNPSSDSNDNSSDGPNDNNNGGANDNNNNGSADTDNGGSNDNSGGGSGGGSNSNSGGGSGGGSNNSSRGGSNRNVDPTRQAASP